MNTELLDVLVKLANLGTSGICVLAIFWCGFQLQQLPNDAPAIRYETLKSFFLLCGVIALISGVTGVFGVYFNRQQIVAERGRADAAIAEAEAERRESATAKIEIQSLKQDALVLQEQLEQYKETWAQIEEKHPEMNGLFRKKARQVKDP